MNRHLSAVAALLLIAVCPTDVTVKPAFADSSNTDAANFGDIDEQLFWSYEQKLAGFRNMEKIGPTRLIPASDTPHLLPKNEIDLGGVEFSIDAAVTTVNEYVESQKVVGLIVVKDGAIVYERYELGNTEESRWISYSVSKSVTSMLVGAAVKDGYIENIDEMITDYVPRLKNSSYDQSSIRNVLQMASGVTWDEDYADPESDVNTMSWATLDAYEYLRDKKRAAEPGEVFNYNTAESNLVGDVVRSAVGNNLSTYLAERIWKPFGMEHDAYWALTEAGGGEFGGCCINATLRDYARIGLFAMNGGVLADGTEVLPEGWMADSTSPSKGYERYGYFWWLRGGQTFAASGIFGQQIHIDPANNLVIALHSVRDDASNPEDWRLQRAAFAALADAAKNLGDDHE